MTDAVTAKAERYRDMLDRALDAADVAAKTGDGEDAGEDVVTMAESYLEDGDHFLEEGAVADALAAFSYGHGWLDAGVRLGVLEADDPELFTVDGPS